MCLRDFQALLCLAMMGQGMGDQGRPLTAGGAPGWPPGHQPQREMDSLNLAGPAPPRPWGHHPSSPRLLVLFILSGFPFAVRA